MWVEVRSTRYFDEQVLRKRPYLRGEWIVSTLAEPLRCERQIDGRVRFWGRVDLAEEGRSYILRVVTLEDGETVHNAFFDRTYREDAP